jgi:sugar fermentation stimulation protein A
MLYSFPPLSFAHIVKRPSAVIKSPYVADSRDDDGATALIHTPGLGCCGLVEAGRRILVSRSSSAAKTQYTAQIAECSDSEGAYYVGIHPMVSQACARGLLDRIDSTVSWASEVTVHEGTRLDFVGTRSDGKKIYLEVKNAMISHELGIRRAERRAIFPEGYRKRHGEPVSPRAVKHCHTLIELLQQPTTAECYLLFTVPRNDCCGGVIVNEDDVVYADAVRACVRAGVKICAFMLSYTPDGVMYDRELPVYITLGS